MYQLSTCTACTCLYQPSLSLTRGPKVRQVKDVLRAIATAKLTHMLWREIACLMLITATEAAAAAAVALAFRDKPTTEWKDETDHLCIQEITHITQSPCLLWQPCLQLLSLLTSSTSTLRSHTHCLSLSLSSKPGAGLSRQRSIPGDDYGVVG